jgi:Glutamate/Leucine/Phenylalanine/Valine dehydrogenase
MQAFTPSHISACTAQRRNVFHFQFTTSLMVKLLLLRPSSTQGVTLRPYAECWRIEIEPSGCATVSYFEWVQDFSSFFWSEDEINARLVRIMKEAFAGVWQVAQDNKVSLRTATFIVACKRILHARELRGLYP